MKKDRRSLVEGLNESSELQEVEKAFVYGERQPETEKSTPQKQKPTTAVPTSEPQNKILPQMAGRIPITVRCRPEIASAIKRVSLQRQLAGVEPYFVQDITEEALENWLLDKGYL